MARQLPNDVQLMTLKTPLVLLPVALVMCAQTLRAQVTQSFTEPYAQREVAASEPGAVGSTNVREGDLVAVGDVLGELQNGHLRQRLRLAELRASSEHAVRSARAMVQIRQKQRDTLLPMLDSGHANQAEVERAILDYTVAFSELEAAEQTHQENGIEVDLIKAEIDRRTMRSPIDGFVTDIHRQRGEYIAAADPKFATIAQLDRLKVRFYLLAETTTRLQQGQQVPLLLGNQRDRIQGTIEFISPVTDPDSGTTRVDVVIENADFRIRSGTVCRWMRSSHSANSTPVNAGED